MTNNYDLTGKKVETHYSIFNVHQPTDARDPSQLEAIAKTAIENGAHVLGSGECYVLLGYPGQISDKNFRKVVGRPVNAYVVREKQPYTDPSELGGSG